MFIIVSCIFAVNVLKKMVVFAQKVPILRIADKRCADDNVLPLSMKKQKTGRSKSNKDVLLIAKLKKGEPVERNDRQQEEFEKLCKGKCRSNITVNSMLL